MVSMHSASRRIWPVVRCGLVGYRDEDNVALYRLRDRLWAGEVWHQAGVPSDGCRARRVGRSPPTVGPPPIPAALQAWVAEVEADTGNQRCGNAARGHANRQ